MLCHGGSAIISWTLVVISSLLVSVMQLDRRRRGSGVCTWPGMKCAAVCGGQAMQSSLLGVSGAAATVVMNVHAGD